MYTFDSDTFDHVQVLTLDKTSALSSVGRCERSTGGPQRQRLLLAGAGGDARAVVHDGRHPLREPDVVRRGSGRGQRLEDPHRAIEQRPGSQRRRVHLHRYQPSPPTCSRRRRQSPAASRSGPAIPASSTSNGETTAWWPRTTSGISGDSDAHVQWFEFQAVRKACGCPGTTVVLVQQGILDPGPASAPISARRPWMRRATWG